MKYLIVYAHPNPNSFNNAIREGVEALLKEAGLEYEVRDLYAEGFDPRLGIEDLKLQAEADAPLEIKKEQEYIEKADVMIFIYPVWWFGMPSIVKGYIDRVFSNGFAFELTERGPKGILENKKVIILNTTGGSEDTLSGAGYIKAVNKTVEDGIFEFCGFEVVLHKYFFSVPYVSDEERKGMLEELNGLEIVQ